ncbi:MAG TPA: DNA starvation/stationary phase protection protein [Dehalococcoidia bacterium]|nr:DNA starvation/stationary phase protection protein [Dehalococcoidia bacterium]
METQVAMAADTRVKVASALQKALAHVMDLSLQAKQAHWNIYGPNFRSLHLQLDEVVNDARTYADLLAERMLALGVPAAGQAADIARGSTLEPLPDGELRDEDVVRLMVDRLGKTAAVCRTAMDEVEEDLASQDILIDVVKGLEKHLWMFQVQQQR